MPFSESLIFAPAQPVRNFIFLNFFSSLNGITLNTLTEPVKQTVGQQSGILYSVMFSPLEPMLIAAAGNGGT